MIYDDGFVAYLNGELVESTNAPANPNWQSAANPNFQRPDGVVLDAYVPFDLTAFRDSLVVGENVLAIHALNQANSSDMLMIPRLISGGSSAHATYRRRFFRGTDSRGAESRITARHRRRHQVQRRSRIL